MAILDALVALVLLALMLVLLEIYSLLNTIETRLGTCRATTRRDEKNRDSGHGG